jgi:hypothetical protein
MAHFAESLHPPSSRVAGPDGPRTLFDRVGDREEGYGLVEMAVSVRGTIAQKL